MSSETGAALSAAATTMPADVTSPGPVPGAAAPPPRLAVARAPRSDEVVFTFSYLSWSAAASRGWFGTEDRLARGLVEHERVRRVLICDRSRSLPLKLLRERVGRDSAPFPAGEDRRLLAPVRLRRRDPASLRGVARGFAAYGRAVERGAREMGLRDPVVITTHPLVAGFADLSWARSVTYYALDDWTEHPAYRPWWAAYRESYRRIRERGHRVAAVSDALLRRIAPSGDALVVPNGLEPTEWELADSRVPGERARTRPLAVYAGTLDARLDVEWLTQAACTLPDATFALVGPVVDAEHLAPLRALPNVEVRAPLPRAELAALLGAADLGLIPHRRSPLTEAMSPLKLYEYLACGLPVVATDLEPMRGVDARVALVRDDGGFTDAVRATLALGRATERERREFVRANSWRSRHDSLLALALA